VMPVAATSVSLGRTGKRAGRGVYRWASISRQRIAVALAAVLAVLAATTYILLPNGDYEPIRPGERGTLGGAVRSLPASTGGRPAFTPEDATKFAPVPTERQQRSPVESRRAPAQPQTEGQQQGGTKTEEKTVRGRAAPVVPELKDRSASATPTPTATQPPPATPTATQTATPALTATPTPGEPAALSTR